MNGKRSRTKKELLLKQTTHLEYIFNLNKSVNFLHDAYSEELYGMKKVMFKKLALLRRFYVANLNPLILSKLEKTKVDISENFLELNLSYGFCDLPLNS